MKLLGSARPHNAANTFLYIIIIINIDGQGVNISVTIILWGIGFPNTGVWLTVSWHLVFVVFHSKILKGQLWFFAPDSFF